MNCPAKAAEPNNKNPAALKRPGLFLSPALPSPRTNGIMARDIAPYPFRYLSNQPSVRAQASAAAAAS